jgi:starch phosphorylase
MIIPAADLSEQISTAGTEASGTSNMKFALNGALTVGTLDGANIEIREEVGADNIFIFGLTADEIGAAAPHTVPCPRAIYNRSPVVRRVVDAVRANRFCPTEPGLFDWLHNTILANHDRYYHLADLESYVKMQARASHAYSNRTEWARKAILNVARIGKFSSDRTVREYARHIWHMPSVEAP